MARRTGSGGWTRWGMDGRTDKWIVDILKLFSRYSKTTSGSLQLDTKKHFQEALMRIHAEVPKSALSCDFTTLTLTLI